jgi:hypothetical protein
MAAAEVVYEALDEVRDAQRRKIIDQQLGRNRSSMGDLLYDRPVIVRESLATRAIKALFGGLGKKEDTEKRKPSTELPGDVTVPPKPPVDESGQRTEGPAAGDVDSDGSDKEDGDDDAGDDPGRRWDRWLAEFQTGGERPKWTNKIIEPLTEMLDADDAAERAAACGVLVALGHKEKALPILHEVATAQPQRFGSLAGVLPWLPWQQREPLFDQLMSEAASD